MNHKMLIRALTIAATAVPLFHTPALSNATLDLKTVDLTRLKLASPPLKLDKANPIPLKYIEWNRQGKRIINRVTVNRRVGRSTGLTAEGREYQLTPPPPLTTLNGEKVYARKPLNWYGSGPALIYRPSANDNIMPAPLDTRGKQHNYAEQKRYLEQRGYRVIGQIGRAFHDGQILLRYFKLNDGKSDPKIGSSAPNLMLSGIVGYKVGLPNSTSKTAWHLITTTSASGLVKS